MIAYFASFAWPELLRRKRQHWIYESRVDNQKVGELLAGKVLGGSSSVNALAFVRGHRTDYDGWEARGLRGYGFANVLRYFRRMEQWEDGASALRGGDGPISVVRAYLPDPLTEAFLSGAEAAGHAPNDDYNGAEQDGFGLVQATIRQGRRCSAADGYLRPNGSGGSIAIENEGSRNAHRNWRWKCQGRAIMSREGR